MTHVNDLWLDMVNNLLAANTGGGGGGLGGGGLKGKMNFILSYYIGSYPGLRLKKYSICLG